MLSAKPWRTDAVVLFILAQTSCFLLGGLTMAVLEKAGVPGFKDFNDPGNILLGTLSFQGATWILMGVFFRQNQVAWADALGFSKKNLFSALILAFFTTILILVVALWLLTVSVNLMKKIHLHPKGEAAVSLLAGANSLPMEIYLGFFAVVLAPVAEEFIFRGLLFPFLKQRGFRKTAWVGVSLFFAFVHNDAAIFIPLFVLALALTWLYEKTDNLLAPIFAHALFNAANLVLLKYAPQ